MSNIPTGFNGYQPDTTAVRSRRADFDLLRRLARVEAALASGGGGGGGGTDEVWVGTGTPPAAQELWYDTDEVAGMGGMPARFAAAGIALTGSFSPAAATVATLNIPAQPVAGVLMLWSTTLIQRLSTTATDIDETVLLKDGTAVSFGRCSGDGAWFTVPIATGAGLTANTATTITVTLQRISGTGNRSTQADSRNNRIDALWIAT